MKLGDLVVFRDPINASHWRGHMFLVKSVNPRSNRAEVWRVDTFAVRVFSQDILRVVSDYVA